MDQLIGERQHVGITTMQDLSDYHLQFLAISWWLISKGHLAVLEQQRTYVRAFQSHFLQSIINWLAIKMTDDHPNIPYKIKDVHEAVWFILQGTTTQVVPTTSSYSSLALPNWNPHYNDGQIHQNHEQGFILLMLMRSHYLWPRKLQNCTIPVNLESI